jgi:hypothetical protein
VAKSSWLRIQSVNHVFALTLTVNLLYRQKAETECDPAASAGDLKTAQDWVDKTMAAKKAKAEKQRAQWGITLEQPTN